MKTRVLVISFLTVSGLSLSIPNVFAKTASCPCSPCKCSPCTCGGGGGPSKGGGGSKSDEKHHEGEAKHHDKGHGHEHHGGGSSVGVGGTVDLGVVGHRNAEPDPFAAGGGEKPVAHTQEKQKTKRKEPEPPTSSTFDEIKLTGVEGKGEITPPSTFNVDNEEPPKLPPTEVFNKEKPKTVTKDDLQKAHDKYFEGVKKYREDNWAKTKTKDEFKKVLKLRDEFDKTDEGKKLIVDWKDVYDKLVGSGMKIGTDMMPPPQNEMEKKKFNVVRAEEGLDFEWKNYNWKKDRAAGDNEEVKKLQKELMDTTDPQKGKEIHAKIEEAWNKAGNDWASSADAKDQMKKVHEAEKELDKAKEAWKPFEKYEEKKAASNP